MIRNTPKKKNNQNLTKPLLIKYKKKIEMEKLNKIILRKPLINKRKIERKNK